MSRVLFSGRCDRAHIGHVATIVRLAKMFDSVLVVLLDYEGQHRLPTYRVQTLRACVPDNVEVITNTTHFGQMAGAEWASYGCDVYAGGNEEVNRHMIELGVPVLWMPRSFDYAASDEYKGKK